MANLGTAVNDAVKLGAKFVSNSYGGGESSADTGYDTKYFNHPGVAITASSGDGGYGVEYPAASPYVTAVGGTALKKSSRTARGWTESVWSTSSTEGAGSGCSAYEPKPDLAEGHRLREAHGRGRLGGRRPRHRCRGVPDLRRLAAGRCTAAPPSPPR